MMGNGTSAAEEQAKRLREKLERELGPTIVAALADPAVVEVMLNADGGLWLDVLGEGMRDTGVRMSAMQAENLLRTIAAALEISVNAEQPILEGTLPFDGSRFAGVLPPISNRPVFAIRKRAGLVFTLDDYVQKGICDPHTADVIRQAVAERQNILIVGSTGSGKTTLANAVLDEICTQHREQRLVIIEDTVELQCSAPNHVALKTSDSADMTRLLRTTMRLRPDRIVVGEVRGAEALALLKAWNTGHPGGLATVHANSAVAGLVRLEQLVQEANVPPQPQLIAEAVDLLVSIVRTPEGRRIQEVVRVTGYSPQTGYTVKRLDAKVTLVEPQRAA
ncbi:MAG: P-type conjugative transfer ATPase TrbB [Candidatus Velthaea sp.]